MGMTFIKRMITEPDKRVLAKFAWTFGWKGMRAVSRFDLFARHRDAYFLLFTTMISVAFAGI